MECVHVLVRANITSHTHTHTHARTHARIHTKLPIQTHTKTPLSVAESTLKEDDNFLGFLFLFTYHLSPHSLCIFFLFCIAFHSTLSVPLMFPLSLFHPPPPPLPFHVFPFVPSFFRAKQDIMRSLPVSSMTSLNGRGHYGPHHVSSPQQIPYGWRDRTLMRNSPSTGSDRDPNGKRKRG